MQFGFSPVQSKATFETMQQQGQLAEELGFDTLWTHEHHTQGMMYPDPLMALAALAATTHRIGLGTNMLLLPIHHPVRVAQTGAMVDILSGGRLRLGVANGYSKVDLATFGVAQSHRGIRLSTGIELIKALWSGQAVTRSGEDFELNDFRLFPLPVQQPAPPVYIGGQVEKAIRRAARLGDNYLISTTETIDNIVQRISIFHDALRESGKPLRKPLLNRIVCTVNTSHEKSVAEQFYGKALLALYKAWGHDNILQLDDADSAIDHLSRTHLIIGEPAECIDKIAEYQAIGIGHIACLMNFGNPDSERVERSMRLFGEQVMPHCQG